jgi:hypothetical protein
MNRIGSGLARKNRQERTSPGRSAPDIINELRPGIVQAREIAQENQFKRTDALQPRVGQSEQGLQEFGCVRQVKDPTRRRCLLRDDSGCAQGGDEFKDFHGLQAFILG